ncbi:Bromodomain-containing factor 1 [Cytospora mali]|uniref:Bromodomain-containing factor 1 n=1 Tax=Cytospora mali TaxID=578113 RepID=A0A194WCD4_CYTMA|nr:Bromodomain-containing factor 1 [Valsa mali]
MAVMASQPELIALDQKSQSLDMAASTSAALTDERNGLEVNGHVSPDNSKPDATSNVKDSAPLSKEQLTSNESNKDAFASNQSISAMTPPAADSAVAVEPSKDGNEAGAGEAQDTKDTEMVDAPTESAQAPSPPAEPVSKPSPKPEPSPEAAAEKPTEATTAVAPVEPSSSTAQSPTTVETTEKPVTAEPSAEADKDMLSISVDELKAGTDKAEDKEATTISKAPSSVPVSPSTSISKPAPDASPETASAPVTVDTSMTDTTSQASAKIPREREEDLDDEPAAKRVRTSGEDGGKGETTPTRPDKSIAPDTMDIDKPAAPPAPAPVSRPVSTSATPVPLSVNGQARKLNDPALANNSITSYQNREIKKVLGLVKKTKSGQLFRASVRNLWPGIWESYRSTINRPVDISFIEQNLRENKYRTMAEFRTDVELLQENATRFNGADHDVTRSAKSTVHQIYARLGEVPAQEPSRPNTKEVKQMPSRHAEHRNPPPPKKESRPVANLPAEKVSDSPVFAIPPSGVPTIRRDSTKNNSDRPKRPIHPPKNKDLGFQPKNPKNKRKPEMKFCEEVLRELKHGKHYNFNQWFLEPVDPVALNIPTYHSIIKQPMDLGTMSEKLDNGEYESANAFKADFNLVVKNCFKFNPEGTVAHMAGKDLEKVFERKWSEKGAWMSKHTQASAHSASATSPRGAARDEDDDEDGESEPEKENSSADVQKAEQALSTIMERLKKEQDNLDKQLYSSEPDPTAIDISRGIIKHLQDEMVKKRSELNALREKKPSQAKPSKKKASGSAASAPKKSSGNAGGPSKKPTATVKKPTKKKLSDEEKEIVSDAISRLEGQSLTRAIEIIKRDTNLTEGEDDELELDMEMLSDDALLKLFDLVLKAFPHYRDQLKKHEPAPAPAHAPAGSNSAAKAAKKKNKPMGKAEQERKLEQLKALKNSYKRPGSGSQEPVPSIEPNDAALFGNHHEDSDDASSSEEE